MRALDLRATTYDPPVTEQAGALATRRVAARLTHDHAAQMVAATGRLSTSTLGQTSSARRRPPVGAVLPAQEATS